MRAVEEVDEDDFGDDAFEVVVRFELGGIRDVESSRISGISDIILSFLVASPRGVIE